MTERCQHVRLGKSSRPVNGITAADLPLCPTHGDVLEPLRWEGPSLICHCKAACAETQIDFDLDDGTLEE